MLRVCFQPVSEQASEKVAVDRHATALVVSCDTAASSPLTSFLHFFQSCDTSYLIDAGSTVTRLVHGPAAESQNVGCSLEHFCCCKLIEMTDPLFHVSTLQPGQVLVDPSKPALVHEDRPIAESCLSRNSSFGSCDHDRPTSEKRRKRWDNILLSQCQKL